jgi:hypothetical protein
LHPKYPIKSGTNLDRTRVSLLEPQSAIPGTEILDFSYSTTEAISDVKFAWLPLTLPHYLIMISNTGLQVAALTSLCTAALYIQHQKRKQPGLPLPPSVKSDPIIGHLRYLPSDDEPRAYRDWGKELDSE